MKKIILLLFMICCCFNYQAYANSSGKMDDGYTYSEVNGVVTVYDEKGKKVETIDTVRGIIYDSNGQKIGTYNEENGNFEIDVVTKDGIHSGKIRVNSDGKNIPTIELSDIDNSNTNIKIETFGDEKNGGTRAVIEGANGERIEETIGSDGSFSISGYEKGEHKGTIKRDLKNRWLEIISK